MKAIRGNIEVGTLPVFWPGDFLFVFRCSPGIYIYRSVCFIVVGIPCVDMGQLAL